MNYENQYTILVNSCDSYNDLWVPFFSLLKKYWNPIDVQIILNTENRDFLFEGLNIKCIHPPKKNCSYGERIYFCLDSIKTEYTILLLDDFFIREPVNQSQIQQIIQWMQKDKSITYFNCDTGNITYCDCEVNKFEGFKRIPPGNDFIFSMQAAIWRTERLKKYWKHKVSPWEWEVFSNCITYNNYSEKFYLPISEKDCFVKYGYNALGMGVHHGKWVKDDVVPFFENEGIKVDYSNRGFYYPKEIKKYYYNSKSLFDRLSIIKRSLGLPFVIRCVLFFLRCKLDNSLYNKYQANYLRFYQEKMQKRFKELNS